MRYLLDLLYKFLGLRRAPPEPFPAKVCMTKIRTDLLRCLWGNAGEALVDYVRENLYMKIPTEHVNRELKGYMR